MKKYTIGRDEECDVRIADYKGLVSRRHAIIKAFGFGKYEITDVSKNGTDINGIRIKPHVAYGVTRKDIIVFANSAKLDWDDIPNPQRRIRFITAIVISVLLILSCILIIVRKASRSESEFSAQPSMPFPAVMSTEPEMSITDKESTPASQASTSELSEKKKTKTLSTKSNFKSPKEENSAEGVPSENEIAKTDQHDVTIDDDAHASNDNNKSLGGD